MPKNLTQKQILIIAGGALVVVILAVIVFLSFKTPAASTQQSSLNIWGTDPANVMNDLITPYIPKGSSNVQIIYKQINPANYQATLLSALAAGTGPDIFEISNRELPQWQNVLAPLPATFATEFNTVTLQNDFPNVVAQDFVSGGNIYALPLSIDTMAMIYNQDLFNAAGIATPPATWDEFLADIPRLRVLNAQGQITQSAVALGGSQTSIANAPDLLYLLMLQNGTQMTNSTYSEATFTTGGAGDTGLAAFNFYLQFSNPGSPYYTWNDGLGDSLQSFIQGKTAVIFDYASSLATIKAQAPFLNIGIAPMPQPTGASVLVNYPNYTGLAVAKYGRVTPAWQFVLDLTTVPANEKVYTSETGEPPALRSMIPDYSTDPVLSVFTTQELTARSWHEVNDTAIDQIFNTAIQNVLNGSSDSTDALMNAQTSVDDLINGGSQ
jgi:multiple sugar transport system substrate-binding protein